MTTTERPTTTSIPAAGSIPAPPRWAGTPACASVSDPELFFPLVETSAAGAAAKAVCAGCELRVRCLEYALSSGMPAGIWGGLTTTEREALVRARRRVARRATGRGQSA